MFLFANSLRKDTLSPLPKKHSSCKGTAHGSGNYGPIEEKECDLDKSSFQRNNSKRWSGRTKLNSRKNSENSIETESVKSVDVSKSPFQRNGSARWSLKSNSKKTEKKPTSLSSDNFSESDSLDSLGDKTKGCDNTDDATKKEHDICNRLYNGVTRSSIAKTAKMRHLDIFDVDENVWVGGLRKSNASDDSDKKSKQKLLNEIENAFDQSRNTSLGRKNHNQNCENGNTTKDTSQEGALNRQKVIHRDSTKRKSFKYKNVSRMKQVGYAEILFMSLNKKTAGFFNVVNKNDCFKDFKDILLKKEIQVGV